MDQGGDWLQPKPSPVAAACKNEALTAMAAGVVVMVVFLALRPPIVLTGAGSVAWTNLVVAGVLAGCIAYFGPRVVAQLRS